MARVVRYAGGWMFDLVMAGWDVAVHITDPTDARPMHILGAHPVPLDRSLAALGRVPRPRALAVDAELYRSDAGVRRVVREAVGRLTEVRLWGDDRPADLDGRTGSVSHQLSVAARAFKAQALAAVAVPADAMDPTEMFYFPAAGRMAS